MTDETKLKARSNGTEGAGPPREGISVSIRLDAVDHSEQPVYSNFTAVQPGSGVVFIDFGFLEPHVMATLARLHRPGVEIPEVVGGKLACRVALGVDTAASLANQLNHLLQAVAARSRPAVSPAPEPEETPTVTH